jgi:hypothetical protein
MVVDVGQLVAVDGEQLLLQFDLFAGGVNVGVLIVALGCERAQRRLVILQKILAGPDGAVFAEAQLDEDIDAQADGRVERFP